METKSDTLELKRSQEQRNENEVWDNEMEMKSGTMELVRTVKAQQVLQRCKV